MPLRWLKNVILMLFGLVAFFAAVVSGPLIAIWLWAFSQLPDLMTLTKVSIATCKIEAAAELRQIEKWRVDALAAVESPDGLNPIAVPSIRNTANFLIDSAKEAFGFERSEHKAAASELLASKFSDDLAPTDPDFLWIFRQLVLADWIEVQLTENEIAQELFDRGYFGNGVVGLDCAAKARYGSTVNSLSLSQFAVLVGMMEGPTIYDPNRDREAALQRRNAVLDVWRKKGIATPEDVDRAKVEPL